MLLRTKIMLDYVSNPHKRRIRILLLLFRVSNAIYYSKARILGWPLFLLYRLYSEWLCCIELRVGTRVGAPLIIDHGFGLVINKNAVLGNGVRLRHLVTIGVRGIEDERLGVAPTLGDNVELGCGCCVLGEIYVGDGVVVGANTVVTKSIDSGMRVIGDRLLQRSGEP